MPTTAAEETLRAIAPEIFEMMLGRSLTPVDDTTDPFGPTERTVTGLVTAAGDWTGAITLKTTSDGAKALAAAMFMIDDVDAVSLDEVRDAWAELTNMAGGNVKNAFCEVGTLGIPTVTEGIGYSVRLPRTEVTHSVTYDCEGVPVVMVILEPKR